MKNPRNFAVPGISVYSAFGQDLEDIYVQMIADIIGISAIGRESHSDLHVQSGFARFHRCHRDPEIHLISGIPLNSIAQRLAGRKSDVGLNSRALVKYAVHIVLKPELAGRFFRHRIFNVL